MTSPAQLKYLDAMGIPVWVSRDLVNEKQSIQLDDTDSINNNVDQTSLQNNDVLKSSSALSILNSLNDIPKKFSNETSNENSLSTTPDNITKDNKANLVTQIDQTVEKTKLSAPVNLDVDYQAIKVTENTNLLHQTSEHYIFAKGNETADWLVIGHSPESYTGIGNEPFAGESGILLNNMLKGVGLENPHQQSYIVNVLDVNQSVQASESSKNELSQKLILIVKSVNPKIVLLVGQVAAQTLLNSEDPLIIMRSKPHSLTESKIPCVVTYYPSYLLQKPIDKRKAWNDLKLSMSLVVTDDS